MAKRNCSAWLCPAPSSPYAFLGCIQDKPLPFSLFPLTFPGLSRGGPAFAGSAFIICSLNSQTNDFVCSHPCPLTRGRSCPWISAELFQKSSFQLCRAGIPTKPALLSVGWAGAEPRAGHTDPTVPTVPRGSGFPEGHGGSQFLLAEGWSCLTPSPV